MQQSRWFQREDKATYQQTHQKGIYHQSPEKYYEEMPQEA